MRNEPVFRDSIIERIAPRVLEMLDILMVPLVLIVSLYPLLRLVKIGKIKGRQDSGVISVLREGVLTRLRTPLKTPLFFLDECGQKR